MKKRILIIIYALLLCVTASFAWLSNFEIKPVNNVLIDFRGKPEGGLATVASFDFDTVLEIADENGDYVSLAKDVPYTFDKKNMIPDSMTSFRIKLKNNSDTESRTTKLILGISIDPEEAKNVNILDVLYLDVVASSGFMNLENYHIYVRLNEAKEIGAAGSGEYTLTLYGEGNELVIPASNGEDRYATIDCKLYFDQEATAEYQNKTIEAMVFRFE